MLSYKLWRRLLWPDTANPLFRRTVDSPPPVLPGLSSRWLLLPFLAILLLNPLLIVALWLLVPVLVFVLSPVLLALLITLAGVYWAASISSALAREQTLRTYDLISVSLDGFLNASWLIAVGCVYRHQLFVLLRVGLLVMMAGGVGLVVLMSGVLVFWPSLDGLRTLLDMLALVAVFYIHHIQTAALSVCAGLFISTFVTNRAEARLLAGLLLLVLQCFSYLLFVLIVWLVEAGLYGSALYPLLPLFYVCLFTIIREGGLIWLWQIVCTRLNSPALMQIPA